MCQALELGEIVREVLLPLAQVGLAAPLGRTGNRRIQPTKLSFGGGIEPIEFCRGFRP